MTEPGDSNAVDDAEAQLRRVLAELVTNSSRFTRLVTSLVSGSSTLSRPWMRALSLLEEYGALRVSDLARLDSTSQPTATALLKQLGEAGLVRRQRDPDDSRAVRIEMTDAGREWLAQARDDVGAVLAAHLRDPDVEQIGRLSQSLHDLREAVKESRKEL